MEVDRTGTISFPYYGADGSMHPLMGESLVLVTGWDVNINAHLPAMFATS